MTIDNVLQEMKEVNEPLEETLYNRLLPEYAKKLDAIATKYPSISREIREELRQCNFVMDVKFGIVQEMWTYCGVDPREFMNIFKDPK